MTTKEINGFVGGISKRPTTIFIQETENGTWYVFEGGNCVTKTHEQVTEGVWIDELSDFDCFTLNEPINTIEEFEQAINS